MLWRLEIPQQLRFLTLAVLGLLLLDTVSAKAQGQPQRNTTEQLRGTYDWTKFDPQQPTAWISPDGLHFACLTSKGISLDGEVKEYEAGVEPKSFTFSPNSARTAYVARVNRGSRQEVLVVDGIASDKGYSHLSAGPRFSPDSQHVACVARLSASSFDKVLLVDGREGEPHPEFTWELAFTPDSARIIYGVRLDKEYGMREERVDGALPRIERNHRPARLVDNFFWGPGGEVGYIAKAEQGQFLVYNGREEKLRFQEISRHDLVISADGQHLAYTAEPQSFRQVAVINGQAGKLYDEILSGSLVLTADGAHWAYAAEEGRKAFIVQDGKEGKAYQEVSRPVFSPNGQYLAYWAMTGNKVCVVVNGKEGQSYDDLGMPVFSPDSKSVAYWAASAKRQFMVHNGQKQKPYDKVWSPTFSPDGKRIAYKAQTAGKQFAVVNGVESKLFDHLSGSILFSPDSRHWAAIVSDAGKQRVLIDGVPGKAYDHILTQAGGKLNFPTADSSSYFAAQGNQIFLVDEKLAAP